MVRLTAILSALCCAVVLAAPAHSAAPARSAGATTVDVKDDFFAPKTKTISRGSSVRFRWRGRQPHDVIASRGGRRIFKIDLRTKGSVSKRFSKAGTYRIICSIHAPKMRATITVR